jgi:hypothetical protein
MCAKRSSEGYAFSKVAAASAASVASVLLGMSLGTSSALAAACTTAPVSTYMASGFSCSVGPVTFSNINATTTTGGSGTVTLTDFVPFTLVHNGATEYGLELIYGSNTGFSGGKADVGWTYDVSGVPSLIDAYAALDGGVTGADAAVTLSEVLSNGSTLGLSGPGVTSTTFSPVGALHVIKDQQDFAAPGSAAFSSILDNGFSNGPAIPEPSTWAMLILGCAGLGFAAFRRSKAYPVFID